MKRNQQPEQMGGDRDCRLALRRGVARISDELFKSFQASRRAFS